MKKEIEFLKRKLGTYRAVAERLGCTYRTVRNVMTGAHAGKFLQIHIVETVQDIKRAKVKDYVPKSKRKK